MEFCRSTCLARPLATAQALAVMRRRSNLIRLGSVGRFILRMVLPYASRPIRPTEVSRVLRVSGKSCLQKPHLVRDMCCDYACTSY